jgi:3-deoxy-D-manno-octulosonic-acid transferase
VRKKRIASAVGFHYCASAMRFVYTVVYAIGFVLLSPVFVYRMWRRGKYKENFLQRFGRYSDELRQRLARKTGPRGWIQAVSVGEVNLALLLIRHLKWQVVLTTTTSTGYALAKQRLPADVTLLYFPQDFPPCVRRAYDLIQPDFVVLMESEVWPNHIWEGHRRGVPIFLVNARMSPRSARRHQKVRWLFRHVFDKLALVCAQSEEDAANFRALGARQVEMTGNLKYDASLTAAPASDVGVELPARRPILVAGSTWPGEEEILLDLLPRLREKSPGLFLVLVPRHVERAPELEELLQRKNVSASDCLLVKTTGQLRSFYEKATVIFVGKSLTAEGGQNIVEAAASGHPVVFGPNMHNFKAIAAEFVAAGACVQVQDRYELEHALRDLLLDETLRAKISAAAKTVIERNVGAAQRTVRLIEERMRGA